MAVKAKAEITLASIRDIQSTTRYYLLQSSTASKPAKPTANPPGGSWVKTEPTYTSGSTNSLYFTDLTVFTDGTFSYSDVSLSSSYEAAKAAYNKAVAAQESIDGIEVGGKNLLLNSSFTADYDKWSNSAHEIVTKDGLLCGHVAGVLAKTQNASQNIFPRIEGDNLNQVYTVSADIKIEDYVAGTTNPYLALYVSGKYDNNGTEASLGATYVGGTIKKVSNNLPPFAGQGWVRVTYTFRFLHVPTKMTFYVYSRDWEGDLYYSRFLGLDKDKETGKIVVNPEQAETVRLIFQLFLEGLTPHAIAKELTSRGIKSPAGKDVWNQQTVRRMLSNEKYKGDALLQKEFTVDFLQKKMKKNEGEVPQYYVEGNHEAIIDPKIFEMVQEELARRARGRTRYSGVTIFSNKIKCADCGSWYGSKVWHSTDQYRKVVYRCNNKYNDKKCETAHVTEEEVMKGFISAFNNLLTEKREIIANAELIRKTLCMTDAREAEKSKLEEEMTVVVEMTQNIVAENARIAQDQDEYQKRYDSLVQRYDTAKARYDEVMAAIAAKEAQSERLARFIKDLKAQNGPVTEFDSKLWGSMVDFLTVGRKKEMVFTFKDGTEIQV